ncbi:MAG: D-hexose-6-phosphate mutarotase [Akkermansiaceae bacterium]|nr:D-hexose-6-phosphate mutarotase [Akkermansiaceae bacterium]
MNLPRSIKRTEPEDGYPVFEIEHPTCSGKVALHGAQVMSWKPVDEEEVLYLSPKAVFREGKAIRGGIPVCWPWFSEHPSDETVPSHGIARTRFWDFVEAAENDQGVVLKFAMREGIWSAEIIIKMGEDLEVMLKTINTNEIPILISGALHSYFAVSDIEQVRVVKLEGVECTDLVGTPTKRKQDTPVEFKREVDAIYESSDPVLLVDDLSGRTLLIEKTGSPSTVLWNPWAEKAKALEDLPDDGYRDFCCVEAAIANDRAEIVMPGQMQVLSTRIVVEE